MKKILIGAFVGGIIFFIWSFLAWGLLPLHLHTFMYTPAQDSILNILANNQTESGAYLMPMADNRNVSGFDSKFHEQSEKVMKENAGKPGTTVYYLKEGYNMDGFTLLRGFLFDLIAAFAVCIMLVPAFSISSSFFGRWWLTLVAGLFLNACGPLIQYNWLGMPWNFTSDMIIDNFLNWGIVGLWFAYYFKGK
ncbi:MAG: hypothetical protein ABIT08_05970 [Bacteroidia bacterium]